jgi:hypothetical protein
MNTKDFLIYVHQTSSLLMCQYGKSHEFNTNYYTNYISSEIFIITVDRFSKVDSSSTAKRFGLGFSVFYHFSFRFEIRSNLVSVNLNINAPKL